LHFPWIPYRSTDLSIETKNLQQKEKIGDFRESIQIHSPAQPVHARTSRLTWQQRMLLLFLLLSFFLLLLLLLLPVLPRLYFVDNLLTAQKEDSNRADEGHTSGPIGHQTQCALIKKMSQKSKFDIDLEVC
jgi:hypothetical protein